MNEQTWHPRDFFRSGLYLAGTAILLVSLVALITASGCGGGGGGGITGLPLSQIAQNGTITGRVIASDLVIASRLAATTQSVKAGAQAIANADVWLEQLPTFRTRTDSEGRFTLTGVPLGSYRVVAKLFSPPDPGNLQDPFREFQPRRGCERARCRRSGRQESG